jgi:predicted transcriptional regulator
MDGKAPDMPRLRHQCRPPSKSTSKVLDGQGKPRQYLYIVNSVYTYKGSNPMSSVLSFRAPDSLTEGLDQLCTATDRDRSYHINAALTQYLDRELWHLKEIKAGMADADAGKLIPLSEVKAKWEKRRANISDS